MASSAKTPHEYTIGGVKVSFPVKAYPSQIAMMAKIINALQKGQNSLLESPTGSGKSLALLCAALAWQRQEQKKVEEYNRAIENGLMEPEVVMVHPDTQEDIEDDPEYFEMGDGFIVPQDDAPEVVPVVPDAGGMVQRKIKRKKVPKIYFGTRTHRQITQIVRELKKTSYKSARMSILGSRDHTCIHPARFQDEEPERRLQGVDRPPEQRETRRRLFVPIQRQDETGQPPFLERLPGHGRSLGLGRLGQSG